MYATKKKKLYKGCFQQSRYEQKNLVLITMTRVKMSI